MTFDVTEGYAGRKAKTHEYGRVVVSDLDSELSLRNLFESRAQTNGAQNDRNPFAPQLSLSQRVMGQPGQQQTLMQKLFPTQSAAGAFQATPAVATDTLQRNPNLQITDAGKASQMAASSMVNVKQAAGNLKNSWDGARSIAVQALNGAASDSNLSPAAAQATLVSDPAIHSKIGAGTALLADNGLGTMATIATGGLFLYNEIATEAKKLSPKEQEELLAATLERLQSPSSAQKDSRVAQSMPEKPDWSAMQAADLKEFLATDLEQQPEMQELEDIRVALEGVDANHGYVERYYADEGPDAGAGNAQTFATVRDAGDIYLSSDFMRGIQSGVNVPEQGFKSEAVAAVPRFEFEPDPRQLALQREQTIQAQFS